VRIISYNVNSVRERLRAVRRVVRKYDPDVLCLQETKVVDALFPIQALQEVGLSSVIISGQKGYHGVAIATKAPPLRSWSHSLCGLPDKRHLAVELADGTEVHNLYVPAGGDKPNPDDNPVFARKLAFLRAMQRWFRSWSDRQTKPRVLVGDFNVAPLESDVWDHHKMRRTMTHTAIEVELLNEAQQALPWTDVRQSMLPLDARSFTWWSYRNPKWQTANKGRRLDHAWVSEALRDRIVGYHVATEVRGWKKPSDHAPVIVDLA
jgi:exodeoxyribonuclease III